MDTGVYFISISEQSADAQALENVRPIVIKDGE